MFWIGVLCGASATICVEFIALIAVAIGRTKGGKK